MLKEQKWSRERMANVKCKDTTPQDLQILTIKNGYVLSVLSKQLLRSGTYIGANIEEAQAAQSTKDFISKLSIANKEARESLYWLKLLKESGYLSNYPETENLFQKVQSIINNKFINKDYKNFTGK